MLDEDTANERWEVTKEELESAVGNAELGPQCFPRVPPSQSFVSNSQGMSSNTGVIDSHPPVHF